MTRQGLGTQIAGRLFADDPTSRLGPLEWIEQQLGETLWSKQREIAASVATSRLTAVPSANGCGKSWLAARLALWWIATHPIGDAIVVATAPTARQIDAVFMAELRAAHLRGQLPGTVTREEWRIGSTLVALARKSSDYIDAERAAASFQGLHRRYVLVLVDEASGIPEWLYRAIPGLTTGAASRTLLIGNPLSPAGPFAEACKPGSGASVVPVSVFDSPNFTEEEVPPRVREALPSPEWVEEMRRDYGEASPAFLARVEGRFPPLADDGLISAAWITEAQQRDLPPQGDVVFGADIARGGSDETAVYRVQGGVARLAHSARGHDLSRTTGAIRRLLRDDQPGAQAIVDEAGLGAGVKDNLAAQHVPVQGFNGANRSTRPDRFANHRAESYWMLREALREGSLDLDPADEVLAAQLLAIRWVTNSRGLIQIESKADMARRGVASPDRADALAMAMVAGAGAMPAWAADEDAEIEGYEFDRRLGQLGSGATYGDPLTAHLLDDDKRRPRW